MKNIPAALAALRKGGAVVLFDDSGREAEADLLFHASAATPKKIAMLRKDAGGLVCLATSGKVAQALDLPFMADVLATSQNSAASSLAIAKTPYGDKPAFSISINSRKTYTGITDEDRARTIKEFADFICGMEFGRKQFAKQFYSPGHVNLLISSGLKNRRGHTELSVGLALLAGMPPSVVLCEMLGEGKALPMKKAKEYAKRKKLPFLTGKDVIEAFGSISCGPGCRCTCKK
jgi:3,4-dihydroxy 2-butanone 4-phosphate synthase